MVPSLYAECFWRFQQPAAEVKILVLLQAGSDTLGKLSAILPEFGSDNWYSSNFAWEQASNECPSFSVLYTHSQMGCFWERTAFRHSISAAFPHHSDPSLNLIENNHKERYRLSFLKFSQGTEHKKHFTCQYCLLLGGVNVNLMFSQAVADGFSWTMTYPWTLWHFILCFWGCQLFPITACQNNKISPAYLEQPA